MPDAEGSVQVVIRNETLWCTQKAMAQLFGVGVPAVSKHLENIFEEGELFQHTTISKMETVRYPRRGKRTYRLLLPRRNHSRRLPSFIAQGHAVPPMGDKDSQGIHHQRLRHGWRTSKAGYSSIRQRLRPCILTHIHDEKSFGTASHTFSATCAAFRCNNPDMSVPQTIRTSDDIVRARLDTLKALYAAMFSGSCNKFSRAIRFCHFSINCL